MVTILNKGAKPSLKTAPVQQTSASQASDKAPVAATAAPVATTATATATAPTGGMKFLKRGAAALQGMKQEEKRIEMREAKNAVRRYWVPEDGKGDITFLDGDLKDGMLDVPFYHEHNINMSGKWGNFFICTQDEEPCPICEGGASPQYVAVLTVIDHTEYTSKKDGKLKKDNVRLFVAKRDTVKLLQALASKRGGLKGARFDVLRTGDKSANVGSSFDFTEKLNHQQLVQKFGKDKADPINYEQYLSVQYQAAGELRKLGFGSSMSPVGSEAPAGGYDV